MKVNQETGGLVENLLIFDVLPGVSPFPNTLTFVCPTYPTVSVFPTTTFPFPITNSTQESLLNLFLAISGEATSVETVEAFLVIFGRSNSL